jgi:hypothetical protein
MRRLALLTVAVLAMLAGIVLVYRTVASTALSGATDVGAMPKEWVA